MISNATPWHTTEFCVFRSMFYTGLLSLSHASCNYFKCYNIVRKIFNIKKRSTSRWTGINLIFCWSSRVMKILTGCPVPTLPLYRFRVWKYHNSTV